MTRTTVLIIVGLMVLWVSPAALAQDDAEETGAATPAGEDKAETTSGGAKSAAATEATEPAKTPQEPQKKEGSAKEEVQVAEAPDVPRKARWAPMKAEYLMANVTHPPLVFDSEQEKLKHEDARLRNLPGVLASGMYEVVRFPAELTLCPFYLATKPVWARERAEP